MTGMENRMMTFFRYLMMSLLVVAGAAMGQQGSDDDTREVRGVLRQTGTIEVLQQDSGYVEISGRRYSVVDGRTRVFAEQRVLRLHQLDNGMVVSYTTDGDGTLLRIDVLGPADKLRELERS